MSKSAIPQPISSPDVARLRLEIHGAVQGVGFRPFIYRLATGLDLTGWVINDSRGVFIEVEGERPTLQLFLERIPQEKPGLAIINSIDDAWLAPAGFESFEIRHSDHQGSKTVLVLPDVATCSDCLREVFNPVDRRFRYPFTNCTNCGPRFSIIQALPYDRPHTTMSQFVLCERCQAEYIDPLDRRFHAQPNACALCGPHLSLYKRVLKGDGQQMGDAESDVAAEFRMTGEGDSALRAAIEAIRAGCIVAVKGLGGFHLMVDARNSEAITTLRERKPRQDKPFAIMARDLQQAGSLVEMTAEAEALLRSVEAPIVLLARRLAAPLAENVAPGNPTLGVMLPYTPLHHLLLQELDFPVVATSGNLSDEPICTDEAEAIERLGHIAEVFLVHDRPIERHVDDSVVWLVEGQPRLLRRARGYAPLPVALAQAAPTLLAVGAHLKNTIALSIENQVFISQHIGDLETVEAMQAFERVIADFLRLYEAEPVAIAHDLHPEYLSTKWARGLEVGGQRPEVGGQRSEVGGTAFNLQSLILNLQSLIPIQHHHAHFASCLAENHVEGQALGVIWDGTGYGTDGTIWGGEFLLGDAYDFQRVAHLRPFRLPGGDAAIKEPRRVAFALLWELYGDTVLEREDLAPVRALAVGERRLLSQMLEQGLNAPLTSSGGRLFDAVAALLDLHQSVSFEGQAAMALEFIADPNETSAYDFPLLQGVEGDKLKVAGSPFNDNTTSSTFNLQPSTYVLDWQPLLEAILRDQQTGIAVATIAARYHNALVEGILAVAQAVGESHVALSGGCFQNRLLVENTAKRLRKSGFEVILHRQVPPNDGGISLGQIAIAAARLQT